MESVIPRARETILQPFCFLLSLFEHIPLTVLCFIQEKIALHFQFYNVQSVTKAAVFIKELNLLRYQSLASLVYQERPYLPLFAILKSMLRWISLLFLNPHPDACVLQNLLKLRYFLLEVEYCWHSSLLKTEKGVFWEDNNLIVIRPELLFTCPYGFQHPRKLFSTYSGRNGVLDFMNSLKFFKLIPSLGKKKSNGCPGTCQKVK